MTHSGAALLLKMSGTKNQSAPSLQASRWLALRASLGKTRTARQVLPLAEA
jgi:hypothetical protein